MAGKRFYTKILRDRRGATAVEYGLMVGMLVLAMMIAMNGFTAEVTAMWGKIQTTLKSH